MLSGPQNSTPKPDLAANLSRLRERIAAAARASGRDVDCVTLLAVSKGHGPDRLREALALGLTAFGESYADEALPKIQALRDAPAEWHFIGRLQANKTRGVAEHFQWVHGVDRLRVAERLSSQRPFHAPPLNVCVQVNIADEASKGGRAPEEVLPLLEAITVLPKLKLRGLMCLLPFEADPATQHRLFARMRALREAASGRGLALDTLSMGMSDDFEAAIEEGSTLVRIGTALFGPRG